MPDLFVITVDFGKESIKTFVYVLGNPAWYDKVVKIILLGICPVSTHTYRNGFITVNATTKVK